ncbi:hypothetical protein EZ428_11835 [Pedobacter frigiditerrae]|uniref:Uncharacterized protein n=1 Tax=Pedobacter frigiditerrae TaxID=2530452 RepID=A0A4R0MZK8_9SPHI|nr:hypothetical protein [Pedobacter frigiditerrae]TCC92403.1 hypothetical protein EZ428_11835 [Pedobacter frigiditerrae]
MAVFNIDIERYYQEIKQQGRELKGFFCIQYPVYCIHTNIRDISPDALDDIDQVICDFLMAKPDFKPSQIASLVGTTKTFIDLRLAVLVKEKFFKKSGRAYVPTEEGLAVFQERKKKREHERSFDFFIDGVTLEPLPAIFYTYYRSKLISEHDSYYHTNAEGKTRVIKPFNPDIVHTPPDMSKIIKGIFDIDKEQREAYSVPSGLVDIGETAFTRQSFHLLISASTHGDKMVKEVVDGSAFFSLYDGDSYYEALRKHVRIFESILTKKIRNLVFKIQIPPFREDLQLQPKPAFISNWTEIDKYKQAEERCFSFSSEDLLKVIDELFQIKDVLPESVVNTETSIGISLTKEMLMGSPDRNKLIENLIRERDYHLVNRSDGGVFLVYLYYSSKDEFVQKVLRFKRLIKLERQNKKFDMTDFLSLHPEFSGEHRELLTAAGEPEILERMDIAEFMVKI